MKSRTSSIESAPTELYIRILPIELLALSKSKHPHPHQYRIFLQKGLQVMGKSETIVEPSQQTPSMFNLQKENNVFDLQVISEKNMVYEFVIYEIDEYDREERIERVEYNLLDHYNTFMKKKEEAEFDFKVQFKNLRFLFQYKLYIHNISDYIAFLTSNLLKKQSVDKQSSSELKLESKEALNKIEQLPSEENFTSNIHPSNHANQPEIQQFTIKKEEEVEEKEVKRDVEKEQIKESGKMKKIVLIVMIMVFVLGLMGSGIIPIGKKKPKGKKKAKSKY